MIRSPHPRQSCLVCALAVLACAAGLAWADDKPVAISFDFTSKYDDGRLGQQLGDMIWKKLERSGAFIVPDSQLETRDFCTARKIQLGPDTPPEQVGKLVREDLAAQIGIWGGVELAPGEEKEIYDLKIRCVDFSGPLPKVVYECNERTKSAAEIPHLYVKQLIDALLERQPEQKGGINPLAETNWRKNPNLVKGDFERGAAGVPAGWEPRCGQEREPVGRLVKWLPDTSNLTTKVIRLSMDEGLGNSYGVMYYSDPFPVQEGATYRLQCRWRSNGPSVKIFVKCYDLIPGEYKRLAPSASGGATSNDAREVYRAQMNLKGPNNQWSEHVQEFTPRHTKYSPKSGRVMLYGYKGAGDVEFDDLVLKQILHAPPPDDPKDKRHSLATKVTVKEMEEMDRRSKEASRKRAKKD